MAGLVGAMTGALASVMHPVDQKFQVSDEEMAQSTYLVVDVLSAENLVAKDRGGTSDPFVSIFADHEHKVRTRVIKKNLNPRWDQSFAVRVAQNRDVVEVKVKDHDLLSKNDSLGSSVIKLADVASYDAVALDLPLDKNGVLHLRVRRVPPTSSVARLVAAHPIAEIAGSRLELANTSIPRGGSLRGSLTLEKPMASLRLRCFMSVKTTVVKVTRGPHAGDGSNKHIYKETSTPYGFHVEVPSDTTSISFEAVVPPDSPPCDARWTGRTGTGHYIDVVEVRAGGDVVKEVVSATPFFVTACYSDARMFGAALEPKTAALPFSSSERFSVTAQVLNQPPLVRGEPLRIQTSASERKPGLQFVTMSKSIARAKGEEKSSIGYFGTVEEAKLPKGQESVVHEFRLDPTVLASVTSGNFTCAMYLRVMYPMAADPRFDSMYGGVVTRVGRESQVLELGPFYVSSSRQPDVENQDKPPGVYLCEINR